MEAATESRPLPAAHFFARLVEVGDDVEQ